MRQVFKKDLPEVSMTTEELLKEIMRVDPLLQALLLEDMYLGYPEPFYRPMDF